MDGRPLEIHPFLHRVPKLHEPTAVAFDCDPGQGADVLTCSRVALLLREVLSELKLESFAKVSGSKGLQVYVPLNGRVTYDITRPFAKAVAELLAEREPKLIVAEMPKVFRAKKVFIDWSQNDDYKTTVSVYSLRAKSHKPFVSMPVTWDELETAARKEDVESLFFEPDAALKRLERVGDLFAPANSMVQKLPSEFVAFLSKRSGGRQTTSNSLEAYSRKRDFSKTAEPVIEGNYYKGFLRVYLNGTKLKGEWTLERTPDDKRGAWRLRKTGGNTRAVSRKRDDQYALTARTMGEIKKSATATWVSKSRS